MKKSCLTCDWCREINVIKYKFYCDLKHSFVTHTFLKSLFCRHYREVYRRKCPKHF